MLVFPLSTFAQGSGSAAGKVVFAMGTPEAINTAGTSRRLARGDEVFQGDRMVTGRGRLQLSMADGAFISVQPNSEYVIDNYTYSGQPDGTEQAVYRLSKGGVRAVTGLIGRSNTEAYKVNTPVATIGIRGTGHNTRICAGDCGSGVRDGLYHNTWEGITYVVNDVDSADVPAGQGVFVQDIDTPIIPQDQPSVVTAAITRTEEIRDDEEETRDTEDQTTIVSTGEQRNTAGDQVVVAGEGGLSPTSSEAISGIGLGGIGPDHEATEGYSDFGLSDASVFVNPDGDVIGILGLDEEGIDGPVRVFGGVDFNAALGADDPLLVEEVRSLLDLIDAESLALFRESPAEVAETTLLGDIGFGRWSNGYFLAIDADGEVFLQELVDNQGLHFIFGTEPAALPVMGGAVYDFIGGTQSTSLSGASIGNGVTGGSILADFGTSSALLRMDVNHNSNLYLVEGPLGISTADNGIFDSGVFASTSASGSACNPDCPTYLDGGFAGSNVSGVPEFLGFEYEIQETDIIMGTAAFSTDAIFSTTVMGITTFAHPTSDGLFVQHGTDNTSYGLWDVYLVTDANSNYIGEVLTDGSGFNWITTIDLFGMLDNNNPTVFSAVSSIFSGIDAAVLSDFESNPAEVVESVTAGDIELGRWGNGHILFAEDFYSYTELMENNQSYHYVNGPEPTSLPLSGSAYYNFTASTQSTTASGLANASGVAVGSGVTDGLILVNFLTSSGSLDMEVTHGNIYHVEGPLMLDASFNEFFDIGTTTAQTTAAGSACNPDCTTYFFGGLLGPNDATTGFPGNLGLYYEIQEYDAGMSSIDPIMGVAAFGLGDSILSLVEKPRVFVAVQPDLLDPEFVDITTGIDAVLHFDTSSGDLIGAIVTTFEDDPIDPMIEYPLRSFGTVDLNAMQLSDDPAAQAELDSLITGGGAGATTGISDFESNPATVADSFDNGVIGFGRWTNGKILTIDEDGITEVFTLAGNQSLHYIYGEDPGLIPTTGSATYNFMGGTRSTSVSGDTLGDGVLSGGFIQVTFDSNIAYLEMEVNHPNTYNSGGLYSINGDLYVGTGTNNEIFDLNTMAFGGTGACTSGCDVFIDGGFAGPTNMSGNPTYIGIEYDIHENDVITGVAGFSN